MSKLISAAVLAAGAATAYKVLQGNKLRLNFPVDKVYDNSAALTPPMGWSSWNTFRNKINENLIYDTAKALKEMENQD